MYLVEKRQEMYNHESSSEFDNAGTVDYSKTQFIIERNDDGKFFVRYGVWSFYIDEALNFLTPDPANQTIERLPGKRNDYSVSEIRFYHN